MTNMHPYDNFLKGEKGALFSENTASGEHKPFNSPLQMDQQPTVYDNNNIKIQTDISTNLCCSCCFGWFILSKKHCFLVSGYKFIVVTTAITNSSRLIEALLDNHVWDVSAHHEGTTHVWVNSSCFIPSSSDMTDRKFPHGLIPSSEQL